MNKNAKPVYMYDLEMNLLKEFKTTGECADYFGKDSDYINHSLKYNAKIRRNGKWYIIKRERVEK